MDKNINVVELYDIDYIIRLEIVRACINLLRNLNLLENADGYGNLKFCNVFSVSSPSQLPIGFVPGPSQPWTFFGEGSRGALLPVTKTGYYEKILSRYVYDKAGAIVGYRWDFRFYHGKPPNGIATEWFVTEFAIEPDTPAAHPRAVFCVNQFPAIVMNESPVEKKSPGYIFRPTNRELVNSYLKKHILGQLIDDNPIPTFDIYSVSSPDLLPFELCKNAAEFEWHFFCHRRDTEQNEQNIIRTDNGHYKLYGRDIVGASHESQVGYIRKFDFYTAKENGEFVKTDWTVREFRTIPRHFEDEDMYDLNEEDCNLVVCKVISYERLRQLSRDL